MAYYLYILLAGMMCLLRLTLCQDNSGGYSCSPGYGFCARENRCSYTLLLSPPDDRRCLPIDQVLPSICGSNGDGEEWDWRQQLQEERAKAETLKSVILDLLQRIDDLEYQKNIAEQEVGRLRSEVNDCQAEEQEDIHDPKFIFNGSSSVTIDSYSDSTDPRLSELTFCLWIKTRPDVNYDRYTALAHYEAATSVPTSNKLAHALSLFLDYVWQYYERGAGGGALQGRIPTDGLWHHVCVAWVGRIGTGRRWLYVDGTGIILGDGHFEHMLGGGVVYLGHAPPTARNSHRFVGEMSQFHMYSIKLDEQTITGMMESCSGYDAEEALLRWPVIIQEETYEAENIEKKATDICRRPGCRLEACMTGGACLENVDTVQGSCICADLEGECPADQTSTKYVLGRSSRLWLEQAGVSRSLSEVTFCLWTRTSTTYNSVTTIFEFEASYGDDDDIQSIYIDHSRLQVTTYDGQEHRGYSRIGSGSGRVNDGLWHHLCLAATISNQATFQIFRDGIQITRSIYDREVHLNGRGTVRLGFSPLKEGRNIFLGDVYGFHMWPVDLGRDWHQMYYMSRQCGRYTTEGAVLAWNSFHSGNDDFHHTDVDEQPADICMRQ